MSDEGSFKQSHAWRSKFRSRHHDLAHEEVSEPQAQDHGAHTVFRGKPQIIDSARLLGELIGRLRVAGSFAYDSEFIGEMSYVPKLCLIQIATTEEIALVDPLASLDLNPLWELLAEEAVEKIVHAGGQDMEPILRTLGRPAANVVDTQIAGAFARLPYPLSLQRLILEIINVRIGKGLTFTHWDQRPLSPQQLRYAADDVRYLPAVWRELKARLQATGNLPWVMQECSSMCAATPYRFDPQTSYLRIRGCGTLDPRQLGIVRELATWRDAAAREADLPPRSFLKDEIMIELARRAPGTEEKLMNVQGLPRPIRVAHSPAILAAVHRGATNPIRHTGEYRKNEELPHQQFRTDAVCSLVQSICFSRGIDPALVLTRSEVGELLQRLRDGQDLSASRLMQGWRKELVGEMIGRLVSEGGGQAFVVDGGDVKTA